MGMLLSYSHPTCYYKQILKKPIPIQDMIYQKKSFFI